VDVTNPAILSLTGLDSSGTYTIIAFVANGSQWHSTIGNWIYTRLVIDGNVVARAGMFSGSTNWNAPANLIGFKTGLTGSTSYNILMQVKVDDGSCLLDFTSNLHAVRIGAIAIRTA
jgi:hypothetical protein